MRGVIVHPEGLETRDMLGVGWPRVRRYAWPQIDRIVLDAGQTIAVDLWDGRREWLPKVGARDQLAAGARKNRDGPRHPDQRRHGHVRRPEDVE